MISKVEKYFIRVDEHNCYAFEEHLTSHHASYSILSRDMASGVASSLYSVYLTSEQALVVKLSFRVLGCLNFSKALGKLVSNCV